VHSAHQCLKLGLCGIRMFSTHAQPGEALASLGSETCWSLCVRRRLNATRTVASIDFLHLLGGMVNCVRKVHSGVNLYRDMAPRVHVSGLRNHRRETIRRLLQAFVVGLNLRLEAGSESTVNHGGHESRRGFSETDCLPARPSSWYPRFLS